MSLLADHNLPFAAALLLMVLLSLVQIVGFGGFEVDADGDIDIDMDSGMHAGWVDALLLSLGIGRLPLTLWLALFLLLFAGLGVGIQSLAGSLLGAPLDMWLGAALAGIAAFPVTGVVARPLARILPRDETTAVSTDSLVGRRARITIGRAMAGSPARARVRDQFGHAHHVMVLPHEDGAEMVEGDEVLLVRREGETFFCIAVQDRRLAPAR